MTDDDTRDPAREPLARAVRALVEHDWPRVTVDHTEYALVSVGWLDGLRSELSEEDGRHAEVSVCPGRRSGTPCVGGTRIAAEHVAEYVWQSGGNARERFGLTRGEMLVVAWYVATYSSKKWRTRWGKWATDHYDALWRADYDAVPDPPTRECRYGQA